MGLNLKERSSNGFDRVAVLPAVWTKWEENLRCRICSLGKREVASKERKINAGNIGRIQIKIQHRLRVKSGAGWWWRFGNMAKIGVGMHCPLGPGREQCPPSSAAGWRCRRTWGSRRRRSCRTPSGPRRWCRLRAPPHLCRHLNHWWCFKNLVVVVPSGAVNRGVLNRVWALRLTYNISNENISSG